MLGFLSSIGPLQGLFGGQASPIGVDLGTETLRLAQVLPDAEHPMLAAAAARDVPMEVLPDPVEYAEFCARSMKEMWREAGFAGRRAVLGVPSTMMHLLHLRLPKVDASEIPQALAFEAAGKLPFDPVSAMLRHHVVGDVYTNDGPRQEVLCTAVRRDFVELLLNAAEKARLEVVGLAAAPIALRDCFGRIYRRTVDAETCFFFVDIGRASTRVTIVRSGHLYFARTIPIGAEQFNQAVADALGVQLMEAKLLRAQLAEQQASLEAQRGDASTAADGYAEAAPAMAMAEHAAASQPPAVHRAAGGSVVTAQPARRIVRVPDEPAGLARPVATMSSSGSGGSSTLVTEMSVGQAMDPVVHALADELQRCRRYHEATFPSVPVDRLVFVGGEAQQRSLCQALARRLGVAAQVGDPVGALCRSGGPADEANHLVAAGIDRRRPQPAWAVACGLSLGAMT